MIDLLLRWLSIGLILLRYSLRSDTRLTILPSLISPTGIYGEPALIRGLLRPLIRLIHPPLIRVILLLLLRNDTFVLWPESVAVGLPYNA